MSYVIERRAKGTTSVSVISCRSREASLISNYIQYELMRRRNGTGEILDPKGGDAGSVSPGVDKSLRTAPRERDDLTTSTRLAIDSTSARKSRKRLGKNWPSRPPIVARQTCQQRRQFCCVHFTGVTTLCDEVPR